MPTVKTIFKARCGLATADAISAKYPNYAAHIINIIERRAEWSMVDRMELSLRGNNTTAYREAGMLVLKDNIFHRLRAYNVAQLTDFMLTRFEDYHVRRLTDVSNTRLPSHGVISRFYPSQKDVCLDDVREVDTIEYCVSSSNRVQTYDVNMELHSSTCEVRRTGAPCKHQAAVVKKYGVASLNLLPVNSVSGRKLFCTIVTGTT